MAKKNFEDSIGKLEELVDQLESGDLSLDDSIKKFEEGIKLYKSCKDLLGESEKKIKVLTESLKEEDFEELIDYKYEFKKDVYTHMDVERFSALAYLFSMGLGVKNLSVLKSMSDRGVGFFETFFKFSDNDPDEIKLSVEKFSEIIGSYILEDL
mgnify:CR=1 FL=1